MIRRPPISTRTDTLFPYTPLFRSVEALAQDTILERGFVSETVDPVAGRIRIAETPLRFSGRFADREILPAPMLGEHTRETLTRILRSEEHTSELQSLMRISYAVFCL